MAPTTSSTSHSQPVPGAATGLLRRPCELAARRNEGAHRYMPNAGFPEVRAAVAAKLRRDHVFPDVTGHEIVMSVVRPGA